MPNNATPRDAAVHGYFAPLMAIIGSAVGSSLVVFGFANSFLKNLVPPFEGNGLTVDFATFVTAIILMVVALMFSKSISAADGRRLATGCVVVLLAAVVLFAYFRDQSRSYVYEYPPVGVQGKAKELRFHGDLTDRGRAFLAGKSISQGVYELGGPDFVDGKGLLWDEESKNRAIGRLEKLYIALTMVLTVSLFLAGLGLWRLKKR